MPVVEEGEEVSRPGYLLPKAEDLPLFWQNFSPLKTYLGIDVLR
jgi:hypothetical protein